MKEVEKAKNRLVKLTEKRILEIGTGTGILSVYFSQLGYDVTGLDYDPGIVALNQRLNRQWEGRASFVHGDMFRLPFPQESFDACYHQGLMEHFDEPQILEALRLQSSICKRVIFTVPTRRWTGGLYGNERLWSARYWRGLLSQFRVYEVFGCSYGNIVSRLLGFVGRKVTRDRPQFVFRAMALAQAGEIGFVIGRR